MGIPIETNNIEQNISNLQLPSGFDSIVCVDTVGEGDTDDLHVIGLCSNITITSQRPVTQIPELGSNYTFLITDAAQNTLSLSRLMPIKTGDPAIGCLSYEIYKHFHLTEDKEVSLIMPDLDNPIYDNPFQLYLLLLKEDTDGRTIKSKIKIDDCMFAQYNIGEIVAGRKIVPETAVFVFGDFTETTT